MSDTFHLPQGCHRGGPWVMRRNLYCQHETACGGIPCKGHPDGENRMCKDLAVQACDYLLKCLLRWPVTMLLNPVGQLSVFNSSVWHSGILSPWNTFFTWLLGHCSVLVLLPHWLLLPSLCWFFSSPWPPNTGGSQVSVLDLFFLSTLTSHSFISFYGIIIYILKLYLQSEPLAWA